MVMTRPEDRARLRWRRKPFPELVRLALPITVSMLSYSIMTLVDTLCVGRLGASSLAAVGLGGTVTFTVVCFGIGALRAEKIIVAMAVGSGRRDRVSAVVGAGLVLAGLLGLASALIGQLVAPLLLFLTDGDEAGHAARDYVAIRSAAAPFFLAAFSIRQARQAIGDAQAPMRVAITANVVNGLLDVVLLFGFGLGVRGVAWGSVVAQMLELLLLLGVQRPDGFGVGRTTRADLAELWRLGAPQGVERLLDASSFSVMVALIARMGPSDLAAHQIGVQLIHFCFLPTFAIAEACSILVGQAVGAGETALVSRVGRSAIGLALVYLLPWSFAYVLVGDGMARWFTTDEETVARAATLLRIGAVLVLVHPFYAVLQGLLRGVGDVRYSVAVTILAAWGCTPVLAGVLGLVLGWGASGGWLGLLVELAVAAGALAARFRSHRWMAAAKRVAERARSVAGEPALAPSGLVRRRAAR
jgi:MATE family multidrug resistance protein